MYVYMYICVFLSDIQPTLSTNRQTSRQFYLKKNINLFVIPLNVTIHWHIEDHPNSSLIKTDQD